MRVSILGCGAVGSAVARILSREKYIDEGICLDVNLRRAKECLGKGLKFEIKKLDARDTKKLFKFVKDVDLIINTLPSWYEARGSVVFLNPKIMEVALAAGVNYLDLACVGDSKNFIAEQLKFHKKFEKEKLLALINAGASPGLTNLLAKDNADELESVERISIRTLEEQRGSEFILPWSRTGMLDEVFDALVYRNGKFKYKPPFSEVITYEFPPPFGKMFCYLVEHDEAYTIPYFIKIRHLDMKAGGSDIEMLRTLYRLGFFKKELISVKGKRVRPREFISAIIPNPPTPKQLVRIVKKGIMEDGFFGVFVECIGKALRKKIFIRSYVMFPSQKEINKKLPGLNYISYPTAICTSSFVKAIYRRRIYGVLPPEALERKIRKRVRDELEKKGIIVNVEYRSL